MAIGEEYPGIEAVVLVGGQKAQEYKHDDVFGELDNISRYIESKDDTEFSIRLLVNEEYKFVPGKHDALGIKLFVDGVKRCTSIWNENRPIDYIYLTGRKIKNQNGTVSVALFKFGTINIVDSEDKDAANLQREQTKNTGTVVVEVARCRVNAMFKGMAKDPDQELETSPKEMMLKAAAGRKLTHRTYFGKEVPKSNTAVKYNVTEIDTAGPIARFAFYYRAKDVLEDLKVQKIDESLPPPLRYQDGPSVGQDLSQIKTRIAPMIKTEGNTTQDFNFNDAYDATPPPLQEQFQAAPTQALAGNDAILQTLLETLSDEKKRNIIQLLTQDNAAQNLQACKPNEAAAAPIHVAIKQERNLRESSRGSPLSIVVSSRRSRQEHLREEGDIIDLSTPSPVEVAFIKPDPGANVSASKSDSDVVIEGQAAAHAASNLSSSTVSGESPVVLCTKAAQMEIQAASAPFSGSLRARIEAGRKLRQQSISAAQVESQVATATGCYPHNAISEVANTSRQGSVSEAKVVASPKTPDQEEAHVYAKETPIYNASSSGIIMDSGKPTSAEGVAVGSEADAMASNVKKAADSVDIEAEIISSIEAVDSTCSASVIFRDRTPSDVSLNPKDLKKQRERSSRPTVTTNSEVAQECFEARSPTPQPDSFMVSNTRAASISSEAEPVRTIDVDMDTGYDVGKDRDDEDEDCGSPSHQLQREFPEDDGFEMIEKPAQVSEITASAIASVAVDKPVRTFEEARAASLSKKRADKKPAERAESVQGVDQSIEGFEEAILATSSPANKPVKSLMGAATPLPVVDSEVQVENTPTSVKKCFPAQQTEVHTDDQDFIGLEAMIPQTPDKQTTPAGPTKNAIITTPTSNKATPNTVERQLSAADKGMADLDLNSTPRKRLFSAQTPRSTGSVGFPITGNAGSGHASGKKSTPVKRERSDDDENDVVEIDGTPSKKMKFLSLGSQDAPISFESDDE